MKSLYFFIRFPKEAGSGPGFEDDIEVNVRSGDLGDREEEFKKRIVSALQEFYPGAHIWPDTMSNEAMEDPNWAGGPPDYLEDPRRN